MGDEKEMFQSTPLCEGRPGSRHGGVLAYWFQSTPLCEGRQLRYVWLYKCRAFQSTPLCEGRRCAIIHDVGRG